MRIDDETLAAWADGALDPARSAEIEAAAAEDAVLAERLRRARRAGAPRAARTGTHEPELVDLASVRARKQAPKLHRRPWPPLGRGVALVLVLAAAAFGLFTMLGGTRLLNPGGPALSINGGRIVAQGALAGALTSNLVLSQPTDAPYRVMSSFRSADGAWCRTFEAEAEKLAGVACREAGAWRVRSLYDATGTPQGQTVDAAAEGRARANGWAR